MTSKISANKITMRSIMREDLRRRTWMIALSLLGSFLASPVAYLLFNGDDRHRYMFVDSAGAPLSAAEIAEKLSLLFSDYIIGMHLILQMVILMVGAAIVAVFGFRHLYTRRMADLCHSIPVARNRLFLAYFLDGFLVWFVPFLAGNLCVWLMMLFRIGHPAYFGNVSAAMAKMILFCVLCFLIVYNGCLVAVMLSGNLMNALLNLILYGAVFFTGNAIIVAEMDHYFETAVISEQYVRPLFVGLSPLASPIVLATYQVADRNNAVGSLLASSSYLGTLFTSIAFMLVNFALAMWLHRKRSSELAERGLEAKWFRIPMRFAVSFFSGLLLSLFFSAITGREGWSLFGAVFGSVLAFTVINIIYHGGFKYLFCHKLQLALVVVLTCGVMCLFQYDLFGYDTYLPKTADIKSCSVYCKSLVGDSYRVRINEDGSAYRSYTNEPNENFRFTDAEAIHNLLEVLIGEPEENRDSLYNTNRTYITVRVDTTHGSYLRRYWLYNDPKYMEAVRPLVESDSYRECYFPASADNWTLPKSICIDTWGNSVVTIEDAERIRQLHEAYRKDFLSEYTVREASKSYTRIHMEYNYPFRNDSSGGIGTCSFELPLPQGNTAVHALLKNWYPDFFWTREDLNLNTLEISFYTDAADLDGLRRYFGLSDSETPDWLQFSKKTGALQTTDFLSYHWYKDITDPEEIAAWKPYLYFNDENYFFGPQSYVYFGMAVFMDEWDSNQVNMDCRVKSGALPEEFAERLLNDLQVEAMSEDGEIPIAH